MACVELRPANPSDVELVFRWRNDPIIVARSSSQTTVSLEEHRRWFSASLQDPHRLIFIIAIDSSPSGLIRFDKIDAESAVISVYLQAAQTGKGIGVEAIKAGARAVSQRWKIGKLVACVRPENEPGKKAFIKAGFTRTDSEPTCTADHIAFCLIIADNG